jgi:hypothetical protein
LVVFPSHSLDFRLELHLSAEWRWFRRASSILEVIFLPGPIFIWASDLNF